MTRWQAVVAADDVHALAEGPYWDAPRERLLWVDITAGAVHEGRLEGERVVRTGSRVVDRYVGAVVCSAAGDLLVAGTHRLIVLSADGKQKDGPVILSAGSPRRLNDGGCDPSGRFLVGSLSLHDRRGREVLVRVEPDGRVTLLDDDLTVSNGLGWSPDAAIFYSVDTVPGIVYARPADDGPRRELMRVRGPDGLCVDAEGFLWIAFWGGHQVRRYTPEGKLAGVVEVAAPNVTSAVFVGTRLVITTAREGLNGAQLRKYPDSGKLFIVDVGVAGVPVTPWAGLLRDKRP